MTIICLLFIVFAACSWWQWNCCYLLWSSLSLHCSNSCSCCCCSVLLQLCNCWLVLQVQLRLLLQLCS